MLRDLFWVVLLPLSFLWAGAQWWRRRRWRRRPRFRAKMKVISVGNIHSGGSGKTPLVMEIAGRFAPMNPVVVSRGYRGQLSKVGGWVTSEARAPWLYGDEPAMIHRLAQVPVRIGVSRIASLRECAGKECGLAILDDGFQHLAVARDVDLVCISARHKVSESYCLPLGTLREPLDALRDAGAIVIFEDEGSREEAAKWGALARELAPDKAVFTAVSKSVEVREQGKRVPFPPTTVWGAICGIAGPERFQSTIRPFGTPAFFKAFPDHHGYNVADFDRLARQAKKLAVTCFVTTEKDVGKVETPLRERGFRVLTVRIDYEIPETFWTYLESELEKK